MVDNMRLPRKMVLSPINGADCRFSPVSMHRVGRACAAPAAGADFVPLGAFERRRSMHPSPCGDMTIMVAPEPAQHASDRVGGGMGLSFRLPVVAVVLSG